MLLANYHMSSVYTSSTASKVEPSPNGACGPSSLSSLPIFRNGRFFNSSPSSSLKVILLRSFRLLQNLDALSNPGDEEWLDLVDAKHKNERLRSAGTGYRYRAVRI